MLKIVNNPHNLEARGSTDLSPLQEASLHKELHSHEPVCVLHAESHLSLHQGWSVVRPGRQRPLLHTHGQ